MTAYSILVDLFLMFLMGAPFVARPEDLNDKHEMVLMY